MDKLEGRAVAGPVGVDSPHPALSFICGGRLNSLERIRRMARQDLEAAVLDLIDEVAALQRRVSAEDDFRTAATSKEVCLCSYKPWPHPKLPAHADSPRVVEAISDAE